MQRSVTKGNVFRDLGYSRAEAAVRAMRIELAAAIEQFVEHKGLTQSQAARFFGVTQPKISKILRGRLDEFTVDYLVRLATLAGRPPRVAFSVRRNRRLPAQNPRRLSSASGTTPATAKQRRAVG